MPDIDSAGESVTIEVDHDRCSGHGQCELIAPEYYELREDGLAYVLKQPVGSDDLELLEETVQRCPTAAIRLTHKPTP